MVSFPANVKTLLEFMLRVLPTTGDSYLPVFRFVHGLCEGESFLTASDEALLLEQLRQSVTTEGEGGGEGGGGVKGESEEVKSEEGDKKNCKCVYTLYKDAPELWTPL